MPSWTRRTGAARGPTAEKLRLAIARWRDWLGVMARRSTVSPATSSKADSSLAICLSYSQGSEGRARTCAMNKDHPLRDHPPGPALGQDIDHEDHARHTENPNYRVHQYSPSARTSSKSVSALESDYHGGL